MRLIVQIYVFQGVEKVAHLGALVRVTLTTRAYKVDDVMFLALRLELPPWIGLTTGKGDGLNNIFLTSKHSNISKMFYTGDIKK